VSLDDTFVRVCAASEVRARRGRRGGGRRDSAGRRARRRRPVLRGVHECSHAQIPCPKGRSRDARWSAGCTLALRPADREAFRPASDRAHTGHPTEVPMATSTSAWFLIMVLTVSARSERASVSQ